MSKKKCFIGHRSLGNILLFGLPSSITIVKRMLRRSFR